MAEYGIPAIRALATPVTGAAPGPGHRQRAAAAAAPMTTASPPRGRRSTSKLIAKGFPRAPRHHVREAVAEHQARASSARPQPDP